jgi:ubiquitin C-terminal hydrolase
MLLQHDCQEFLALLLDNLHEQLNTASCKSILSDVSTPPPTPHSQCEILDEREPVRKITDGSDQESFTQVSVWEWNSFHP